MRSWPFAFVVCALMWLVFLPINTGRAGGGATTPPQAQLVPVGLLPFQDESGLNAPPPLCLKITNELKQQLVVSYKDVLPRLLSAGVDPSTSTVASAEQAVALGKRNGVKFVIRGGLLAVTTEGVSSATKVRVQLYANITSVETGGETNLRAEGSAAQTGPVVELSTVDPNGAGFRDSALAQALTAATTQLASAIHDALVEPAQEAAARAEPAPTPDSSAAATDAEAAQAAADQELQQLIAQAEATLSGSPNSSAGNMNALRQALEGLKAALATKAGLLQERRDTGAADQEIAARKQEMQTALANLTAEASSGNSSAQTQQPAAEKKSLAAHIDEFAGEALSLLQKIQELRSTLRDVREDQSANNSPPQDATAAQGSGVQTGQPVEQTTGTVSGVVTNDGNPVAGAIVTNQETGESAATDTAGAFSLKGLVAGRLSQLTVTKNGQLLGRGQVDVPKGRVAIADFQTGTSHAGGMPASALPGVLAATVVANPAGATGVSTGTLKGEVRDSAGRPVPFALVQMPGVGMARTDARGRYTFVNVPVGSYTIAVRPNGMKPETARVAVAANASTEARVQFAPTDIISDSSPSLLQAGAGTVLRGTVLDEQGRPLAAAKVYAFQSGAAVSVLTAPTGSYELLNLKPGAYKVSAFKVGYQAASQAVALKAGATEQRNFQLSPLASAALNRLIRMTSVPQGESRGTQRARAATPIGGNATTSQPAVRTGQLVGRVTDGKGQPVAGASVTLQHQQRAATDQEGNYTLAGLPPDIYRITVSRRGFAEEDRTVTVRGGGPTRQDFVLQTAVGTTREANRQPPSGNARSTGGQITGRVIDGQTGAPLAGATVSIAGHRTSTTGADGGFVFNELAPGTYQISAMKSGFTEAQRSVILRGAETVAANFVMNPSPPRPIRITKRP